MGAGSDSKVEASKTTGEPEHAQHFYAYRAGWNRCNSFIHSELAQPVLRAS